MSDTDVRIVEIEGLMGKSGSEYWRGPTSVTLQQEYRDLVDQRDAAVSPSDQVGDLSTDRSPAPGRGPDTYFTDQATVAIMNELTHELVNDGILTETQIGRLRPYLAKHASRLEPLMRAKFGGGR